MKKGKLFQGLTAAFGSVLAVCAFMSSLAFQREADINNFLHIKFNDATSGSKYSSKEELAKAESEYFTQMGEEGSVLLTNKNNALPLKNEKKVTLFGNASVKTVYHGASGGPANSGFSLKEALQEQGFEVNNTVYEKTKAVSRQQKNSDIGEVDAGIYVKDDWKDYSDVAIVVLARYGGEQNDMDVKDSYGVAELSLHDSEKAVLEKVKNGGFKKIIVLLNTGYAMDMGWLDSYNVDACMWIGYPGQEGMHGVGNILAGKASPSGSLVDTYATSSLSSPAMQNFGDFKFEDLPNDMYHCEYLVYQEGIYVGYKYYETRYFDQVRNKNNAKSAKGAFIDTTGWDYAKEMVFPFGYGLTYTDFEEKLTSLDWDREKHVVTADIQVKNTGSFAAKDTVELYCSLPYETGNAEKSAIQLIGFGKTGTLAQNETETVHLEFSDYIFATYDENATNGKDTNLKGCYVFDPGDYYFSLGTDSHDALNNVLASMNVNGLFDQNGKSVTGNKENVKKVSLAALDNKTYAVSPYTGKTVSNQFDTADLNHFEKDKVKYLTRNDWNTFPDPMVGLKADDDASGTIRKYMTATKSLYTKPEGAKDISSFKFNQDVTLNFIDMKDVPLNDPKWDTFVDQLSPSDMALIFGDKHGHDAIEKVNFPQGTQGDGPDGLQAGGSLHSSETNAASTWNLELLKKRGEFLAEDAIHYAGFCGAFGGGCNMHRTPYGGRNFEYYSEDSTIAYYCGAAQAEASSKGGLITMFKHFMANDQETNRHGVATFMNEQTLRQNEARSFEGALSMKGGSLGNMSSYNRLGVVSSACYKPLMTTLLREEWGFEGISITDSSKDATSYLFTADAIDAGTTVFDNDADRTTEVKNLLIKNKDGHIWEKAREACKYYFYAHSKSNLTYSLDTGKEIKAQTPWWKTAIISLDVSLGVLTLLGLAGFVVFTFVVKKKGE